jgi:hypothetical protein
MDAAPDAQLPRLVGLWEQIAARYKHRPASVYFELLRVWAVAGGQRSWALEGQPHESECPTPFAFTPDSRTVAG